MKKVRQWLSAILVLILLFAGLPGTGQALLSANAYAVQQGEDSFMRMFQVDSGRKYFTVAEIQGILDEMATNGYTHLVLAIGNEGLRFLPDDMSVTAGGQTYSGDAVKAAIRAGNDSYDSSIGYSVSGTEEWSQADMEQILSYAALKGIEIVPLLNIPGHATALNAAMRTLGVGSSSGQDLDVSSSSETAFALALLQKYAAYFAGKGCSSFNFGADEYGSLSTQYADFRSFFNQCSAVIKAAGLTPMAFNDCVNRTDISESSASDTDYQYSIVMVDCGRKYFSLANLKALVDNAADAGMYYVMLGLGNDGLRFLLDDMSLTVNGSSYSSTAVASAIHSGNEAYSNFTVDELTESEMNELIAYAAAKGVEIVPLINTPGHMDAILDAAESLTGVTCSYNGSGRTIDVTNATAKAFTKALLQKYITYFSGKGCSLFNMGCDEYANDIYTSGGMGFGNLSTSGKYSYFVSYVNDIAAMVEAAGMTPMAFNDGIYYNNNKSSGTFDSDIIICYWSSGWSGYNVRSAANLAADGFRMLNAHGDYYWVLGKSDAQCTAAKAAGFSKTGFSGSTVANPVGAMFLIWCDYPQADTDTNVINTTANVIKSFGSTLPQTTAHSTGASDSFDTDVTLCYWASGSGYASVQSLSDAGFRLLNYNNAWYYVLGDYLYAAWASGQWGYADSKAALQSVPVTQFADGNTSVAAAGSCLCFWCDSPGYCTFASVSDRVYDLLGTMASANPEYFGGHSHSYQLQAQQLPTCTEAGSTTYCCEECGDTKVIAEAALGHDYVSTNQAGDTLYSCSRCGDSYTEELPQQSVTLQVGESSEEILLDGTYNIAYEGPSGIASAQVSHVQTPGNQVSYSASVLGSMGAYSTYYVTNVIDGSASTYYWSNSAQTAGSYVKVDLGALVRFDAISVSSVAHTDYCVNANVQVSADGNTWTTIGTHTGSSSTAVSTVYPVPASVEEFRYIRVLLTQSRSYWWKLAEIAWGSYDGSTFSRAATSGTVGSAPVEQTALSFTGESAGSTYYVINGTRYLITVEGAAHTHSYASEVTTPAGCESDGLMTHLCAECGDSYTEAIPATGHSYLSQVTAPTCTTLGYTTYTCRVCGGSYVADTVAALGHQETLTSDTATCTADGVKTQTCERCGSTREESSPALGHSFTVTATEASCTQSGASVYTCSRCGFSYTEETPALAHDYRTAVTAPTCTAGGYTTYTCRVCGDSYTGNETAALGHAYTADVTEATCTADGYTTFTCSRCGDSYTDGRVAALGHRYEETVTLPTCTENGYTTGVCSRCGDTRVSSTTSALGHSYLYTVVEPTCEAAGCTEYLCEICGDHGTKDAVPALGHDYSSTEEGNDLVYTCSRCADSYREPLLTVVAVSLGQGETYRFNATSAGPVQSTDSAVATVSVSALSAGMTQATDLEDGSYLLTNSSYRLTTTASTYYSSWDSAGTINGLAMGSFSQSGSYDDDIFTITAVSGGYYIQAADGRYLTITEGSKSTHLTLSTLPQVLSIQDLGTTFAIASGSTYLDRYSSAFAAAYPGSVNENEAWTLYRISEAGYQYTITGTGNGETVLIVDGIRYEIFVHSHTYTAEVTAEAGCTTAGTRTYTCPCGDSYTEAIPATGHSYTAEVTAEAGCTAAGTRTYTCHCGASYTEAIPAIGHSYTASVEEDSVVYTCSRCGDSYTEALAQTSYDQVTTIASGNTYVITAYSSGSYYALTHNGTTVSVRAITVSNGKITSEVTEDMLWNYNGKLYYNNGSRNYYLGRTSYGWGSYKLTLSTSGTNATFSNSRLGFSNYYLKYSSGSLTLVRSGYSTCYVFKQNG